MLEKHFEKVGFANVRHTQADKTEHGKMLCATVEDIFKHGELENFPDLSDGNGNWPALIKAEGN